MRKILSVVKEDTTEHVLSCSKMPLHQLTQDDLYNVEDIGLWRKIVKLYSCNNTGCAAMVEYRKAMKTAAALALNSYDAVTNKKQAQEHGQNREMQENQSRTN